ncbi:hypothetical protein Rxycam_00039 [Rubrobacter xylanophilus DSM 9941]|nr:hypothetical protein Rxycam_00039 [Rubrobacter xylanophilus DSM 9941]
MRFGSVPDDSMITGLIRLAAAAALTVLLFVSGLGEGAAAYAGAALLAAFGLAGVAGHPRRLLREPLVPLLADACAASLFVLGSGGDSPLFPLYFLAALGLVRMREVWRQLCGGGLLLAGYALVSGEFSEGNLVRGGLLAAFCLGAVVLGRELRGLSGRGRELAARATRERELAGRLAELGERFGPVLGLLDPGRVLEWAVGAARELSGAAYAHAVLIDANLHRTSMGEGPDACPTWWHPAVQELVLRSARSGEPVRRPGLGVHGVEGFLAVPVEVPGGEHGGALVVGGGRFGEVEERLLRVLAGQLSAALRDAGDAPGGRDVTTGLPNRASLHRVLRQELSYGGAATLVSVRLEGLEGFTRSNGMALSEALVRRIGGRLAGRHRTFRYGVDEFCLLVRGAEGVRARRVARWARDVVREVAGDLEASVGYAVSSGGAREPEELLAEARRPREEGEARRRLEVEVREVVAALHEAASVRDPELGEHMREVSRIARSVGEKLGLSPAELEALTYGALLHDIGKLGVPDAILSKPSALSPREYEIVKLHTEHGARILRRVRALSEAMLAVRHHHERFDGGGYPDGLQGADIPLLARIVFVADAFDSMTRSRPYRSGASRREALKEIALNSGSQFDPRVVEALFEVMEELERRRLSSA